MIPNQSATSERNHEFFEPELETQNDAGDDLIPGHNTFDSSFSVATPKRRPPSSIRNMKDDAKKKLARCLKAYKQKRIYLIIGVIVILLIFLFWLHGAFVGTYATMPRIPYKLPDFRAKEKPFINKTFTNPTQFAKLDDLKIEPTDHIPMLEISVNVYDVDHLNIVIRDSNKVRYEVPFEDPYPHGSYKGHLSLEESLFDLKLDLENFNIQVIRRDTKETLFSFKDRFVYSDLYIEFSFDLPTREVYGIGERLTSLQLKPGYYTIFVINRSGFIDTGEQGLNQEGHHPMYLVKERSGKYHINLIRNLSPQEAFLRKDTRVNWKFTGGVIDFNFFLGNGPEEVIEKYHRYCGGWTKPAMWHLGAHLNKWFGYKTVDELEFVLAQHKRLQIPLDVLWNDIDVYIYLWNQVVNTERYPPEKMKALFNNYQKKWIPVVDPYVMETPLKERKDVVAYNHSLLESIYLRDQKGRICDGMGFHNRIRLVDFLNPDTEVYWGDILDELNKFCPVSGVWADDNEISIFKETEEEVNQFKGSEFWDLPFYPGGKNFYELPLPNANCLHYGGVYEHDIRSVPGHYQSIYTFNSLKKRFSFPFVLSRATMFGGAQYAYHWIPDTFSDWPTLRASIGTILTFQIFGYSMVGSDVCGFIGNTRTDGELCARWYQSAVFYPFHRNSHQPTNDLNNWQEPYMYFNEYFKGIVNSLYLRYSLLRHFHTLFFETKIGEKGQRGYGMVLKPLFIEFGKEEGFPLYGDLKNEEEFMVGNSLLVAPALYPNVTEVEVYFPSGIRWYDVRTFQEVLPDEKSLSNISALVEEEPPYFLRGGHMIIKQDTKDVYSTADLGNHINLIAGSNTVGNEKEETITYNLMLISNVSDENTVYNSCVLGECMVTLELVISQTSNEETKITLKTADVANISDEYVYLDALYIMGLDLNKRLLKSSSQGTSLDTSSSKTIAWESSYEDNDKSTVKISFAEALTIRKSSEFAIYI